MRTETRMRRWFAATHGVQFELLRHFLREQLSSTLFSSDQLRRVIVTSLAALAFLQPVIVRLYIEKYQYLQSLPTPNLYLQAVRADRLFFVSLSMIVGGIVSASQWQRLFPSREDFLILKPLPLRPYQISFVRFLSAFLVVATVVVVLNLFGSILFPLLTSGRWQSPRFGLRYIAIHFSVVVAAGLAMFFLVAALAGLLLNLLPTAAFRRASSALQAIFAVALCAAVPYAFELPNQIAWPQAHSIAWFPPSWFAAGYEILLGARDLQFLRLSRYAFLAPSIVIVGTLLFYFISARLQTVRVLEDGGRTRRPLWKRAPHAVSNLLSSRPRTTAILSFVEKTLRRSPHHRLISYCSSGIAAIMAAQSIVPALVSAFHSSTPWEPWQRQACAAAPLIVGCVLICALTYSFQLPVDPKANWIFKLSEPYGGPDLLAAADWAISVFAIIPAVISALPIEVLVLGRTRAALITALSTAWLLLFAQLRLHDRHQIPFTCPYSTGTTSVWHTIGAVSLLFGIAIPVVAGLETRFLSTIFDPLLLITLGLLYAFFWRRQQVQCSLIPLAFTDREETAISLLKIINE